MYFPLYFIPIFSKIIFLPSCCQPDKVSQSSQLFSITPNLSPFFFSFLLLTLLQMSPFSPSLPSLTQPPPPFPLAMTTLFLCLWVTQIYFTRSELLQICLPTFSWYHILAPLEREKKRIRIYKYLFI